VNLYPEECKKKEAVAWKQRLDEMSDWYRNFVLEPEQAAGGFHDDYSPYAALLQELRGCVLDLGGGIGVTRHFLGAATHYVVLDPSLDWFSADWGTLSKEFPCLSSFPCFVHGVGERLPFHDDSFDAVVALWSLNHVRDPETVFSEVHRVLVPGGRFIAVLEDMIPRWHDTLLPSRRFSGEARWHALLPSCRFTYRGRWRPRMFARKAWLAACREQWPLQSDHLRILEQDIATWTSGRLELKRREWVGSYLSLELARPELRPDQRAACIRDLLKTTKMRTH
jgi:SAM-dependent methyltransferase